MAILIDSTVFVDGERGRLDLSAWMNTHPDESPFMSIITLVELYHGLFMATTTERHETRLAYLELSRQLAPHILLNPDIAETAGRLRADLQKAGTPIGAHDLLIGATALHHGWPVATANVRDFERIPGLEILHWRGDPSGEDSSS